MSRSIGKKRRGKTRRFTYVYLENWRNFLRVDVELQRRVFLVGANASGKSNFLDVFRFLNDIVSVGGGFQYAVRRRGGVSALRCLAARRYPNIIIRICIGSPTTSSTEVVQASDIAASEWEYELHFSQDNRRRPLIKKEKVVGSGCEILSRPNKEDKEDPERLTQTYLEQVNVNQEFRAVADFFTSIRYLHIVPQLVREPDRSVGKKNDPYGGDFLEQIAITPEKTRNARLRRIRDALRVAVPQLKEVELSRDIRGTPHIRGKYDHWRPHGAWQTEDHFSDGSLRLLGLLWASLDGNGPLLLEEPELSLHPEVVRFMPQMFARIKRRTGRQTLISTHSTEMLMDNGIGLNEVLLLQPGIEGTTMSPANKFAAIKVLIDGGVSIAEAVIPQTRPEKAEQLTLFGDNYK